MHCARKGETKRDRKNTDDKKHGSDDDTEDEEDISRPSSSHQLPSNKRKVSDKKLIKQ